MNGSGRLIDTVILQFYNCQTTKPKLNIVWLDFTFDLCLLDMLLVFLSIHNLIILRYLRT